MKKHFWITIVLCLSLVLNYPFHRAYTLRQNLLTSKKLMEHSSSHGCI